MSATSDLSPIYERTLAWMRSCSEPVVTSSEVAEWSGLTRQGANRRLNRLEDLGHIQSKNVGAAAKVYWVSDS